VTSPAVATTGTPDILVAYEPASVATITLNRPARINAIRLDMWVALRTILADLAAQDAVRAVILTGAGGNFSAGADISEFARNRVGAEAGMRYEDHYRAAVDTVRTFPKPVIAAVSGNCMGGACALAMACDFRIADASARFAIPASKLGVVYGMPECRLLFALVGVSNAKRILFLGDPVEAGEAERMGLVDRLVEGPVLAAAMALAEQMAGLAPLSISGHKTILNALAAGDAEARAHELHELVRAAVESADYQEGVKAFGEKRKPRFVGK
jgi:enoyl-CoA hydratase/carnithine racemase